ncbi:MAG: DUF502 domain-containing protein [Dehalococcoidia bacterium]|jgi:uncharacterized membrane protein|nr:DUF502 domain-containing protein [Dehalococcoidia bacterium]
MLLKRFFLHIRTTLIAGLLAILPIGVTLFVLKFFFELLDPILGPIFDMGNVRIFPGLGVIVLLILLYVVGIITTKILSARIVNLGHKLIERIPVISSIYSTTRSGVEILSGTQGFESRGVVLVDFPRPAMKAIGLITAELGVLNGEPMVAVYIPTTPVPSSGFLIVVALSDVTPTDISVDDAMKIIVSGGILANEIFSSTLKDM